MKNKLTDLNNHLFAQLERLGDESLKGDALKGELGRAEAIVAVSEQIVNTAALRLKATQLMAEHGVVLPEAMAIEDKRP